MLAIAVVGERTGLTHQRVDDVAVIYAIVGSAALSRKLIYFLAAIPDLKGIGEDTRLNDLPDQTAVHRVAVPLHHDQAAGVHSRSHPFGTLNTSIGQWLQ